MLREPKKEDFIRPDDAVVMFKKSIKPYDLIFVEEEGFETLTSHRTLLTIMEYCALMFVKQTICTEQRIIRQAFLQGYEHIDVVPPYLLTAYCWIIDQDETDIWVVVSLEASESAEKNSGIIQQTAIRFSAVDEDQRRIPW